MNALLEHRQWVRALARSLMADEHAADDLEQQTWLAALRRPPRGGFSRAWLGTVLRNLAGKERRREARLFRRERLAARPEALAPADDLVAEAEAHRRVVDAVLGLEEPYRSTLLLRYFRDLGPAEIARRDGIPRETVRARLRRALQQLRDRFEREEGRAAWGTFLLPLLGGTEAAARTSVLTAATGATVMGKKVVVFFAIWALLATALYTRELSRAPSVAARSASPPEASARRRDDAPAAGTAPRSTDATAREELEAFHRQWLGSRVGDLRGRLVDARTGTPLRVEAAIVLEGEIPAGSRLRFETSSSPDGTFVVAGTRYPLRYRASCINEDEGIECAEDVYANEECAEITIAVRPRTLVQGRVVDLDGRPLPQAQAHVSFREGLEPRHTAVPVDAEGRFRAFVDAPAESGLVLAAAAPGHFPSLGQMDREGTRSYRGQVRLAPGPRIVGRLLDDDGRPVAGAEVRLVSRGAFEADDEQPDQRLWFALGLHPMWAFWPAENRSLVAVGPSFATDAEGRLEGWAAEPGMEIWALVDIADRPPWCRRIPVEDARATIDLGTVRLPARGPGLAVMLQTASRAPLAGATVEFSDADLPPGILVRRPAITDSAGTARSPCLVPGKRYYVRIEATDTTREDNQEFEARDGIVLTVPAR